jgi:hypothetical protein
MKRTRIRTEKVGRSPPNPRRGAAAINRRGSLCRITLKLSVGDMGAEHPMLRQEVICPYPKTDGVDPALDVVRQVSAPLLGQQARSMFRLNSRVRE